MSSGSDTSIRSAFAVFRSPAFFLLWIGKFISTAGSALSWLAASILVFRLTSSALSVGLLYIAQVLPSLFIGLIAGVFVDRYNRKQLMIISDLIRIGLSLLIPILVLHVLTIGIPGNIIWLYVLVILSNVAAQFFDPAFSSVLPEVASAEELAAANSLMQISSFGSTAVGFALSGLIIANAPIQWAFFLDAFTFFFSAVCILFAKFPYLKVDGKTNAAMIFVNLREGIKHLYTSSILRSLYIITIPVLLGAGLWNALLLPFAVNALHANTFQFGLQEGLTSIGFVVCSLLLAGIANKFREGQLVSISVIVMGILALYYSQLSSIVLAIIVVTVQGFFNAPRYVAQSVLIQRHTPREKLGRVFSAFFVSRDVLFLIGMAMVGLADILGVRVVCIICGVLWLGSGLISFIIPGLRYSPSEWWQILQNLPWLKSEKAK